MLLLVEGEEKECLPKFGVPIFILAHKLNKFYSLSWKHCSVFHYSEGPPYSRETLPGIVCSIIVRSHCTPVRLSPV